MAKVATTISSQISSLSKKELEKLVLKAAAKDKSFHDYLLVTYFEKEYGEQDLFDEAKEDLEVLFLKRYKGYAEEEKTAHLLAECGQRITAFSKVCKNKSLEADLITHVLEIPFSMGKRSFETCFTSFNYKTVLLVKRMIVLVQSKMHEDYKMQYQSKVNDYLEILHSTCNYLDYVFALPEHI
ncbi:MAG TPA: hypothetical protein VIJ27_11085 [Mucilaginibacter sp.]